MAAFFDMKKTAAPGAVRLTMKTHETDFERRFENLHSRVHRGAYWAMPGRRVCISKLEPQRPPAAVAALEDEIV